MPQNETREITLRVRTVFLAEFEQDRGGLDLPAYLSEIIESIAAERRASRIHKEERATKLSAVRHKQMSPENVQRILHLHSEGLSTDVIAVRMGVSRSAIVYAFQSASRRKSS